MRIRFFMLVVAAFSLLASAQAGTITVTFTVASAGAISCNHVGTYFASCSDSNSVGSGSAVADVSSGHLGASVSASTTGFVGAGGFFTVDMGLKGFTAADVMEIDMSLNGTFLNGGANASVHVDDGISTPMSYGIACGDGIVFLYNRNCNPAGGVERVFIPLDNVDTLSLMFQLQPGITQAPGYASFLNSFDSTIKVPDGTTILNGPGGTFFQPQSSTVPEPGSLLLIGSGLLASLTWRGKRHARSRTRKPR